MILKYDQHSHKNIIEHIMGYITKQDKVMS